MKSTVGNGRHCKCHDCKELRKIGVLFRPESTHKWFLMKGGKETQVSEKEFKEYIATVETPKRDDLAEVVKS